MKGLKQRNLPWLGAVVDSLYTSLPILSIINFLAIITVLYTNIREHLLPWMPWLSFWMFVVAMITFVVVMMVLIYKFVLPSLWTFRNKQMHGWESSLGKEIEGLREDVRRLEVMLTGGEK